MVRGSGAAWDLRKAQPYECYSEFDFDIPIGKNGDCFDRYLIRMEEMRQSTRIMKQCLEKLRSPRGRVRSRSTINKIVPPQAWRDEAFDGSAHPSLQTLHRGLLMCRPARCTPPSKRRRASSASIWSLTVPTSLTSARSVHPGFAHLQAMDFLCRGHLLADVSAILGSIDIVFGEVDR